MTALTLHTVATGRRARRHRWVMVTSGLAVLVVALIATTLVVGQTFYPLQDILAVLGGEQVPGASFTIGRLRLPRALVGATAGAAFGLAGATFQTLLRNPLASPDVIGISAGSSAAAVFCILTLGWSGLAVQLAAVSVGLLTAGLIAFLARGGEAAGGRLILIGIGVGAMLNAVVSYLLARANSWDIPTAIRWLTGSLNNAHMDSLAPLALTLLVLGAAILVLGRDLQAMALGEATATALGVRVEVVRIALVLCAVGLVSTATATTGPIAFVAFLSGPIAARLIGSGGTSVPAAALTGAALVLTADLIGQFAFDTRFPVGVVTGILGAPYLLFLLTHLNRAGGSA